MELDSRKKQILLAIIQNYQETGEPVGSRTISKVAGLSVSAATIRNEMSDLEEMGLIVKPHTSAGSIPTDKGYRLYVDELMEREKQLPAVKSGGEELIIKRVDRLEELLMQMARILAENTKYATMVSGPKYSSNVLKFIQLSKLEEHKLLAVIVFTGNIIKNHIIGIDETLADEEVLNLNLLLNNGLNGLSIGEINLGVISKLKEEAGDKRRIVEKVLDAVASTVDNEEVKVFTSGTPNIFQYPELSGGDRASELISTLEDKDDLHTVLGDLPALQDKHEIKVFIGDEVPVESMKDCSVVTATYELASGVQGKIGIIGPKRMDYEKVVATLKDTMSQLDVIFKEEQNEK